MVAALLGALRRSTSARYACAFISAIAARFCSITGVMSTNVVGVKLQSSGWCGSKRRSSGGVHRLERARDARAGRQRARALDREERDRVVRVERVAVGVRDEHVGRELADPVGDRDERVPVDLERVVAEVEALERRRRARPRPAPPRRGGSPSRARPSGPAPSRARPTRPARRRRARARARPAGRGRDRDRAAGAPDEVGRVRPDHEQPPAHASPASRRELSDDHLAHLVLVEAGVEQPVGPEREPVLDRRVVRVAAVAREEVALDADRADAVEDVLPGRLAAVAAWSGSARSGSRGRRARPGPRSRSSGTGTPGA